MSASPTTPTSGGSSTFAYILGGVGFLLGLFLFVVAATSFFGQIGAQEFSPDNFTRRTYTYYQIPLTGIQVTPTSMLTGASELETYLANQKLIPPPTGSTPRWDMIRDHSSLASQAPGAASILTTYLDIRQPDDNLIWLKWSKEHPDEAKILWPMVTELAREGWYHALPDLFNFALGTPDPMTFQEELDKLVATRYFTEGELLRQQGKTAEARKCYDRCLKLDPMHSEAAKQRAALPAEQRGALPAEAKSEK